MRTAAPVTEIRRWLSEYALTWGWMFGRPTDASHHVRLLVLKDGYRWSPGDVCSNPAAR
jgi:hypothetical protein